MLNNLLHPKTWHDWLQIYFSIGAFALCILVIQALRSMRSDFARNLMRALGHQKTFKELAQDWMIYLFAAIVVLIGWPGFLIWVFLEEKQKAKNLEWQKRSVFSAAPEYLVKKVTIDIAESESYIDDPLGYTPNLPFGHLNQAWLMFKSGMQENDELWFFNIPQGAQHGKYQLQAASEIQGYALIQNMEVVDEFFIAYP